MRRLRGRAIQYSNDREAENREPKNLNENSEEADERSEDETSTVLMDTDDFTDDVNTTGVLVPDGTVTTGNIEVEGDSDWFAIEVIAGNTYNVDFSTLPSGPDLEFSLYDNLGNFIAAGDPFFQDSFIFTATETTTYYVQADAFEVGPFFLNCALGLKYY